MNGAIAAELWSSVQALKGTFQNPDPLSGFSPDAKDFLFKTFGVSSLFRPYDLSPAAEFLYPVFSPIRNRMPRLHLQGANMQFKAITNPNVNASTGLIAEGNAPDELQTQYADVTTFFKAMAMRSDPVTMEQLYVGAGKQGDFNVDSRAIAAVNLLKAFIPTEERWMLGGVGAQAQIATVNSSPVNGLVYTIGGAVGNAPAGGSVASSSTGGTIGAVTVDVQYVAVTSWAIVAAGQMTSGVLPYGTSQQGQSLPQTADLSTGALTGTTNSITFTPPNATTTGYPIIGWAVYLGTAGQGGAHYYAGFTTGKPLTLTSVPVSGQQPPATDYSYGAVTGGTGSSVEGAYNGMIPWLMGTGSNAGINAINGKPTLADYQNAFVNQFESAAADPDLFLISAPDLNVLNDLVTATGSASPYWFAAEQGAAQGNVTAGFRVSRFLNPATGRILPLEVHFYLPQGTALALTMDLPAWFPGNNVPSGWTWGGAMDYTEIDYQPTPNYRKWASDIENLGAIHCFLPSQNIIWTGLATS